MKLDQKDIQILKLLQNNARLSNKEVAAELDIAPSTCHERLKRLTGEGFFKSFNADLNLKKLGINVQVIVSVRLNKHEREVINSFIKRTRTLKGVIKFYHMAGDTDFMIHIGVKDSEDLRSFILDKLANFSYIDHIETAMIFYDECVCNLSIFESEALE